MEVYVANADQLPGGSIGLLTARINFSTAITSEIIAAPGDGLSIHILGGILHVGGNTDITEYDGGTAITGAMSVAARGNLLIQSALISSNKAYQIASSAAVIIAGRVSYKIVRVS